MLKLIIKWLIFAGVIMGTCYLPGISVDGFEFAMLIALVLTVINIFIKPLLKLVAFPINLLTFGLFNLVINFGILYGVSYLIPQYHLENLLSAFYASVIIAVAFVILKKVQSLYCKSYRIFKIVKKNHPFDVGDFFTFIKQFFFLQSIAVPLHVLGLLLQVTEFDS